MKRRIRGIGWGAAGLWGVLLASSPPAAAKVYLTHAEALSLAFPKGVKVERKVLFLTDRQTAAIEARAGRGAKVTSKLVPYYRGTRDGTLTGYAVFDTHTVRTKPETFMVVVDPDGAVRFVELLLFDEPEEFLPPEKWREAFKGRKLDDTLQVRRGLSNVSGATLTSLAFADGVRRILATLPELLAEDAKPAKLPPWDPPGDTLRTRTPPNRP